jgi:alanine dehydrogenase
MIIGIPKELKVAEKRVAITPAGVGMLRKEGHIVLIEAGAGSGSGFSDENYLRAGAELRTDPEEIWVDSEMILKVKEPIAPEFDRMHGGQILLTFLHLAADKGLTEKLIEKKIIGIAYETIQTEKGSLPLLAPMSAIAGRLSVQAGAYCLEAKNGGMGILLSGVSGVRPAYVVILGGGVAGVHACFGAVGNDARVSLLDVNQDRLNYIDEIMHGRVTTLISNDENIEEEVLKADLLISSVLIPGARAPKLIPRKLTKEMKRGAAIVDISIDQGGCCETSSPTTHDNPTYLEEGVVHYCVTNMPGVVPRTSTMALTNATLPYVLEIANKGYERAMKENLEIGKGINLIRGELVHKAVAESLGMNYTPIC